MAIAIYCPQCASNLDLDREERLGIAQNVEQGHLYSCSECGKHMFKGRKSLVVSADFDKVSDAHDLFWKDYRRSIV
jgi:RNase P subunit RPR2